MLVIFEPHPLVGMACWLWEKPPPSLYIMVCAISVSCVQLHWTCFVQVCPSYFYVSHASVSTTCQSCITIACLQVVPGLFWRSAHDIPCGASCVFPSVCFNLLVSGLHLHFTLNASLLKKTYHIYRTHDVTLETYHFHVGNSLCTLFPNVLSQHMCYLRSYSCVRVGLAVFGS